MSQSDLRRFKPHHEFFLGIDSDGCVFDTMEAKQKQFFIPAALEHFSLWEIASELKETWEFVNLYSLNRGGNRFISLIKVFDLLKQRLTAEKLYLLPDLTPLRDWVEKESRLGNNTLRSYFEKNFSPELEKIVTWTEAINKNISENLRNIPPFPNARKAIEKAAEQCDIVIVSQTPLEALEREWKENGLMKYVQMVAGQEHGTKAQHIEMAAKNKYPLSRILMIGDAIGDLEAAQSNGILFYPIIPGKEAKSWAQFLKEGFNKFLSGKYSGTYEDMLVRDFTLSLPSEPGWK